MTDAWIITGPTSGIGHRTALRLAKHGTVVLVGRDQSKLDGVKGEIETGGGTALTVVADFSDIASVRRAADEIIAMDIPIAGLLNNAGISPNEPSTSAQGWDLAFATNHLGPFAFTEALIPHLPDGANVVFIVSAVEDPDRKIAVRVGYRGSRYISAEAAARGEWMSPGEAATYNLNAYPTSKQGGLATVLSFAREFPRLHFRAIEPGVTPGTNLSRDSSRAVQVTAKVLSPVLALFPYFTTAGRAAKMITGVTTDRSSASGIYYDEKGNPMSGSRQVSDPAYQDRYVAESRQLLSTV
ncbi:MAG TPA: SDR family NAD(P)-dependent oxidoreductase [Pseudolysinimonas sp.]|jgi:NAD(P)-dependent dehydrogenase (short-subunit alcohol dehydrogenase family)